MSIREVKDETALPFDRDGTRGHWQWIRHKIDPTVLIDCASGECFTRRDGAKWEHPAYSVEKNAAGEWEAIRPRNAHYDTEIYTPTSKKGRAA